ncbi:hypothetical protein [Pelagicoccus sp. SDUM812002]|uniref:hypothetical protein n=1 Tax=Pelagicoccus sp. SDUM812002 TaxID=3041266 RepID=UPI00281023B1|nr:hypothetical protein [Pelagicoccus sp. SDUM812002]MDQ8186903.1 hypothetical protein [Pelagicoccus sp. SDUM812002]
MKNRNARISEKRGSVVMAVFVITTALAVVLGAILSHSLTERKINARHELRLIAKNASEAVVEYGFAQLRHKFENQTNFSNSALSPSSADALSMPSSNLFGSNVDHTKSEIIGGIIDDYPTTLTFIDPANPANEFDPLRGQSVYARQIALYAKATVIDPRGGPDITNYVTQKMQVRDAPLFAHAIFYNLDLEVSPGPKMEIHGPVHANGNLYLQAINGVDFHYPVSTASDMFYGWGTSVRSAQGSGGESLQSGHVKFKNRAGNLASMKVNNSYKDSNMSNWRTYAADRWNGNLLTQEHGVETYNPVAFPDYLPDNPTTAAYDPLNSGHQLIEAPLSVVHPDYNEEVEKQKLSNKAGLYITWDVQTNEVRLYNEGGIRYDITHLEGSGANKLFEIKSDVMYDHRRNEYITMLEFNVGKLKQLIEDPDYSVDNEHIKPYDAYGTVPADGSSVYTNACYNPGADWNGIVYVECKTSSSDANEQARLHYSGVRLWGGETDAWKQGIPSRGADPGMTLATNNALYVLGDFNADGSLHETNTSENSSVVPELGEVPVALFGDSVTILSENWDENRSSYDANSFSTKKQDARSTEVAAAIVSGLIPSNANGNGRSSGGVHNFPRFLENWSGDDLYIRGSLVCLYESEVDDSAWRIDYYGPPGRKWGFSQLFLDGTFPPGTPLLRTYRRINYTNLTKEEYEDRISTLPWQVTSN